MTLVLFLFDLCVLRARLWCFSYLGSLLLDFDAWCRWFVFFGVSFLWLSGLIPRTLRDVVSLQQKSGQMLQRRRRSTLDPLALRHRWTPELSRQFLFSLSFELVYICYGCIPRFGSFSARFRLYARAGFVAEAALQNSSSARASRFRVFSVVLAMFPLHNGLFRPSIQLLVLRLALLIAFAPLCGTSRRGSHIKQKLQPT